MTTDTVSRSAPTTRGLQGSVAAGPAGSRSRARQYAGDRWWRPLRRTISSEWIKLRTVRSTAFALAVAVLGLVLMAAFAAVGSVVADSPENASGGGPLGGSLAGIPLAELAVAVLGVLVVTGEYGSRLIRVTLAANPRRWPVAVAKAAVVAAAVFVTTLAALLAAVATTALVLSTDGIPVSLTAPGALRALLAGPAYLAGISVLAVGFGWILRSTAGALAVIFVVLYVLPVVGFVLPAEVAATVVPLLPGNAGNAMMQLAPSGLLSPGAGFAVFSGYATATMAAAVVVLRHRDA